MPPWYKRTLPAQEALARANNYLDKARNTQDRKQALKNCDNVKEALERMDILGSTNYHDQVIAVYRENGRILDDFGFKADARLNYSEADKLR